MTIPERRAEELATDLSRWLDEPMNRATVRSARRNWDELAEILRVQPALRRRFATALLNVFVRTGYVKDFRSLERYTRRTNSPELLDEVDEVVRAELPDVWVLRALQRGDTDAAVECWFDNEAHDRARLAADELVKACQGRIDVLVSGRLSVVAYQIGRGTRSRYRRACRVLIRLRDELIRAEELETWQIALDDVLHRFGHRPALMDELQKAGIVDSS